MSVQEEKMDMNAMIDLGMAWQGKQITDQRGGSRGLSRIRPEMMQQVLSSIALYQEKKVASFPTRMELLDLFPESRTPWEPKTIASSYPLFSNEVTDSRSVSGSSSEKQSTAELTIFYNGSVQVYHVSADKAEAVMKLASSSSLGERSTLKPSDGENQHSKKLTAGLPMARKLSLQRFLQKRKDRLGSLSPFTSISTDHKAKEDGDELQPISLSLSFPSQRSG